jgi:hypothetical protein
MEEYEVGFPSNGITSIQNFVKISQLVGNFLKKGR